MSATRPRLILGVKRIAKAKGTVVKCKATSCTVVAVEVALTVTDADPVRHKRRQATAELARQQYYFFGGSQFYVDNVTLLTIN